MVIIGKVVTRIATMPGHARSRRLRWYDILDDEGRFVFQVECDKLEGKRVIVSIREIVEMDELSVKVNKE